MVIHIKLVTLPQECEEIYQFRYSIYVEEMSRIQIHADHEKKRVCDPLDNYSNLFLACSDGCIVGTLRSSYSRNQKSEIRNQKSEIRNQKSEIRNQKSEIRNQASTIMSIFMKCST
jgi:Acetyltransferase (GNAT) domain